MHWCIGHTIIFNAFSFHYIDSLPSQVSKLHSYMFSLKKSRIQMQNHTKNIHSKTNQIFFLRIYLYSAKTVWHRPTLKSAQSIYFGGAQSFCLSMMINKIYSFSYDASFSFMFAPNYLINSAATVLHCTPNF